MADGYHWRGGHEAMLRLGPPGRRPIIVSPALFEEANRSRAFTVAVMRALAGHGIASVLPDLPGTNESLLPTERARLDDWRAAFADCARAVDAVAALAIRGGALVDGDAPLRARCHLSPVTGETVVRSLVRIRLAGAREGGERFDPAELDRPGPPLDLGGNHLSRDLLRVLRDAVPVTADRTLRLAGDPSPADRHLPGRPLWRGSEPDVDSPLAAAVAADVATWYGSCAG